MTGAREGAARRQVRSDVRQSAAPGLALALGVLVALGGAGAEEASDAKTRPQAASPVLVEAGRGLFLEHCATCHGVEARGDGPVAPALAQKPADLTRIAARRDGTFPTGDVAATIDGRFLPTAHGSRVMPVWGRVLGEPLGDAATADEVSRGRIDALVAYLATIQQR